MNTLSLLKYFSLVAACTLTLQTAKAQQAYLSGANLYGNQDGRFYMQGSKPGVPGPYIQFNPNNDNNNYPTQQGTIGLIAGYSASSSNISHNFVLRQYENGNLAWISYLRMLQTGQVQIGRQIPQTQTDYALAVDGKVVAKSLFVTAPGNWADFVFAPTYQPMSLPKLEQFLQLNKHLPAIPSASEVAANGYNVTEMDAKLLQSLEELTLHVIALSKEVEQLKAEKAAATNSK